MLPSMKHRRRIGITFVTLGLAGLLIGALLTSLALSPAAGGFFYFVGVLLALGAIVMIGAGTVALVKSTRP